MKDKTALILLAIALLLTLVSLLITDLITIPGLKREIAFAQGKIFDLEEYCERLNEDVKLQRDVFSAYVNGDLVE